MARRTRGLDARVSRDSGFGVRDSRGSGGTNVRLSRLWRMPAVEIAWRTRETLVTTGDRLRARVRTPRWQRGGEFESIAAAVVERLRRQPARFVINPLIAGDVAEAVTTRWPDAGRAA